MYKVIVHKPLFERLSFIPLYAKGVSFIHLYPNRYTTTALDMSRHVKGWHYLREMDTITLEIPD
jgi:hypothetical protein